MQTTDDRRNKNQINKYRWLLAAASSIHWGLIFCSHAKCEKNLFGRWFKALFIHKFTMKSVDGARHLSIVSWQRRPYGRTMFTCWYFVCDFFSPATAFFFWLSYFHLICVQLHILFGINETDNNESRKKIKEMPPFEWDCWRGGVCIFFLILFSLFRWMLL